MRQGSGLQGGRGPGINVWSLHINHHPQARPAVMKTSFVRPPAFSSALCASALLALLLFALTTSLFATDFGDPTEVKHVRKVVARKFGHVLHASISHDWALCTASSGQSDMSVVLHRSSSGWKIVASDGGAYVAETLKPFGISDDDIPALLKAYQ